MCKKTCSEDTAINIMGCRFICEKVNVSPMLSFNGIDKKSISTTNFYVKGTVTRSPYHIYRNSIIDFDPSNSFTNHGNENNTDAEG